MNSKFNRLVLLVMKGFDRMNKAPFDYQVDNFDPLSFISYTDECQAKLENGAHCYMPAAGHFTALGGLVTIPLCSLHICLAMRRLMQTLDQNGGDWNKVLEHAGDQHFLHILLTELENDASPFLKPTGEI